MNAAAAFKTNGLDVSLISPSKGNKYSPNLYRWLTRKNRYKQRNCMQDLARVFEDKDGALWIGYLDDFFVGTRLMYALCHGTQKMTGAYMPFEMKEVEDFWPRYMAIGRCAIDPNHQLSFYQENRYWIQGDTRTCHWCGAKQKQRKWTEQVERSEWVNSP